MPRSHTANERQPTSVKLRPFEDGRLDSIARQLPV
jgi:hypothetical protein